MKFKDFSSEFWLWLYALCFIGNFVNFVRILIFEHDFSWKSILFGSAGLVAFLSARSEMKKVKNS
ncbi:hypothetical protein [Bacillus mycoides]|uniref:hypothetical protein n=1 Tax=Bacillus mycoides TaxID=1405 RepID=UPI0011AA72FB|nr:hypothetical protein [Bacillus mycoides]